MPWISKKELAQLKADLRINTGSLKIYKESVKGAKDEISKFKEALRAILPEELQPKPEKRTTVFTGVVSTYPYEVEVEDWSNLHAAAAAVRNAERSQENAELVKIVNRMKGKK